MEVQALERSKMSDKVERFGLYHVWEKNEEPPKNRAQVLYEI